MASLKSFVRQFENDANRVSEWASADENTSVDMGGGPVRSPAKLIKDNDIRINETGLLAEVNDAADRAEQSAIDAADLGGLTTGADLVAISDETPVPSVQNLVAGATDPINAQAQALLNRIQMFRDTSPEGGASLIPYLPPYLGSTVRTLKKEIDSRSGVRLLAFSDLETRVPGVTDDSLAAAKAVAALKVLGAGALILPDGDVRINNSVVIVGSDIQVTGGSYTRVINGTTNAPAFDFGDEDEMHFRCGIRNVIFSQASGVIPVEGNCGYRARNQGSFVERDIHVYEYPSALYNGLVWSRVVAGAFSNRAVQGCKSDGCIFDQICNDIYFDTWRSDANGGSGVVWRDAQGVFGSNATALYNDVFGWDVGTDGNNDNKNYFLANVCCDMNGRDNWRITQLVTGKFSQCWGSTQKSLSEYLTACGFFIDGQYVKNLTFLGGDALYNNGHGMYLGRVDNVEIISFSGGIDGNGNGRAGLASGLFVSANARDVRTRGGSFRANSDRGITVEDGAINAILDGASLKNNTVSPLKNDSESTIIRNCDGYNPQMGAVVSPDVPASGAQVRNSTGSDATVYISGGTVSAVFINGAYVTNQSPATIRLPPGSQISMTYTVEPSWKWMGE